MTKSYKTRVIDLRRNTGYSGLAKTAGRDPLQGRVGSKDALTKKRLANLGKTSPGKKRGRG